MKNLSLLTIAILFVVCTPWESPYDPDNPEYVYPFFKVDSTTTTFLNNDTIADSILQMVVIGNDVKSQFRWRLDSSASWNDWVEKGTTPYIIYIGPVDSGWHNLDVQTCYNPNAHVADSTFKFYRACCPVITKQLLNQNEVSDTHIEIRHGSTCTLTVLGSGTNPISYKWYRDSICTDSTGVNTMVLHNFQPHDSGNYFCIVSNKWCATTSNTFVLKYLPPIQYAPEAQPDTFALNEDDSLVVSIANGLLKNDSDKNNDILTTVLSDSTQHGTIFLKSDGSFIYKPDQDFFGIDTFNYRAKDLKEFSTTTRVTITVRLVNDSPFIAKNTGITVQEGSSTSIASSKLSITDVDDKPSTITFTLVVEPKHGKLMKNGTAISDSGTFTQGDIVANTISYQHDGSEISKDMMLFSVCDGAGAHIDSVQVIIGITSVNDTPYIQTKNSLSVVESGVKVIGNIVLFVKDNDNPASDITFSLVDLPVNGKLLKQGNELHVGETFTQEDIDSQRLIYQHNGGNTDKDSLSFTIADKDGASISETMFRINIRLTDDPPVALDDLDNCLNEDSSIILTLVANDPEEKPIVSYEVVSNPKHGTLTGTGNSRTYTSSLNFNGTDTLTFRASDGSNWSNVAMLVITIIPKNDKPEWKQQNVDLSVKEGQTLSVDVSSLFKYDIDNDSVHFVKESGVGSIASDGKTFIYSPNFQSSQTLPYTTVIRAVDNGIPELSSNISLTIAVEDSTCKLNFLIKAGVGTVSLLPNQTIFDPNTEVTITANPQNGYVFDLWTGDIPLQTADTATIKIVMDKDKSISASFLKLVETATINASGNSFSSLLYAEGYIFALACSEPARLVRFKADCLADYIVTDLPFRQDAPSKMCYSSYTKKIYLFWGTLSETNIAEIDPVLRTYASSFFKDTTEGLLQGAITTDSNYVYLASCRYTNRKWTGTCIRKFCITNPASAPIILRLDSTYSKIKTIQSKSGYLYLAGSGTANAWICEIRQSDMSPFGHAILPANTPSEQSAIFENNFFIGVQTSSEGVQGRVFKIENTNIDQYNYINTKVMNTDQSPSANNGVSSGLGYIWGHSQMVMVYSQKLNHYLLMSLIIN